MITPYDNMPLLTFFASQAITVVDPTKSAKGKAEEAFEIAQWMLVLHNEKKIAPGVMRKAGDIPVKKSDRE